MAAGNLWIAVKFRSERTFRGSRRKLPGKSAGEVRGRSRGSSNLPNLSPTKHVLGFRGPATRVFWELQAQSWKKSPKMSSWEQSRKRVKIDCFSTILTLFRLRFRLFGPRGREAPGTHFQTLFPTLGPKGPNDPCSRQKLS